MRRFLAFVALVLAGVMTVGAWAQAPKGKDQAKTAQSAKLEDLIAKGEYQKAVDLAKKFIEAKEVTEGLYIDLGVAYQKLKDYPNAISAYEEATKLNPFGTQALINEASCYQEMNDAGKLADTLKRIVDLDPGNKDMRYTLALMYDKQEKADDAFAQYDEIYKVDPGYKDVAYAIGLILFNKGEYEKAEPYFAKAVEVAPSDDQALLAEGQNFIKQKKFDKAVVPLKTYLDITKNEATKPAVTGQVAGLYAKSASSAMEAVKGSKDKAEIAKAQSVANEAYANAIVYFDKLLALRPNSELALEGKANALIMTDRPAEAVPVLKQYLQISQNETEKKKVAELVKQLESAKKK